MKKQERPAFKMNVEVVLKPDEIKQCGKDLADALNGIEKTEAEIAAFKAQKKSEAAAFEATIQRCRTLINTGREFRMTECEWDYDWKAGRKTGRRKDTGEVVSREEITDQERQLDFAPKAGKKDGAA